MPYIPSLDSDFEEQNNNPLTHPSVNDPTIGGGSDYEPLGNAYMDQNRPIPSLQTSSIGTNVGDPTTGEVDYHQASSGGEVRPVSQILSDRIAANGAYRDGPSYMADVRKETYRLSKALGYDLTTPEGQNFVEKTVSAARSAAGDFVQPPMEKGQFIETPYGMFDAVTKTMHTFDGKNIDYNHPENNQSIQPPPASTSSITPDDIEKQKDSQYKQALTRQSQRLNDPSGIALSTPQAKRDDAIIKSREKELSDKEKSDDKATANEDKSVSKIHEDAVKAITGSKQYQNYKIVSDNASSLEGLVDQAGKGKFASDAAAVESFQKIFNPTAAVREFSYQNTLSGRNVMDAASGIFQKITKGQTLTKQDVSDMKDISKIALSIQQKSAKDVATPWVNQIQKHKNGDIDQGLPADLVPLFKVDPVIQKIIDSGRKAGDTVTAGGKKYLFTGTSLKPL